MNLIKKLQMLRKDETCVIIIHIHSHNCVILQDEGEQSH